MERRGYCGRCVVEIAGVLFCIGVRREVVARVPSHLALKSSFFNNHSADIRCRASLANLYWPRVFLFLLRFGLPATKLKPPIPHTLHPAIPNDAVR